MSRHDPQVTLRQIAECAGRAQELCERDELPGILRDWQKRFAFERAMELLGEAVKRLPVELLSRYPAVDWRGIAGMRDHVSHGYDSIDYDLLWQSVKTRIPGLLSTVEQMLKDLQSASGK
jgi:uncharacterized protein with HEPN domain